MSGRRKSSAARRDMTRAIRRAISANRAGGPSANDIGPRKNVSGTLSFRAERRNLALNEPMKSMRDSSSPAAPRNDRLDGFSAARRTAALQRQFPHALKSERRFILSSGRMEDW